MTTQNALAVRNSQGKVIGLIENGVFFKNISEIHLLRKPPAICIDADPFDKLIRPSCHSIIVRVRDGQNRGEYVTPMINFITYKGEIDRGHGKQYFMILERWQKR